jgi:hypothetical protein
MIEARHRPIFESAFALYTAVLMRRRFSGVWVKGSLPDTRAPLVVAAQHVAWWDPMLLFYLSRFRFSGAHYVMMEEPNLRRLGFFRWIGAFGVDRASRAGVASALRYALARLHEPRARVWLFPQGAIAPADKRPLECDRGASWLAARARVPVVAVAIRYEFLEEQFPAAYVSFSAPRMIERDPVERDPVERDPVERDPVGRDPVEAMLEAEADALKSALVARRLDGFDRVLAGRRSISDLFSRANSRG